MRATPFAWRPGMPPSLLATLGPEEAPDGLGDAPLRLLAAFAGSATRVALAEFSLALPWRGLEAGGGRLLRFLAPADLPGGAEASN